MTSSVDENPLLRERFAEVFSRLPEQDIEQFYARYQVWLLRRRVPMLQKQIEALDEHLAENQRVLQSLQPSAVALAVLARLQANGVSNIELLDQLLARGEDWLDRMMQRLDYCEQVQDFIQGDYTQWCFRSLEGAYDWIDTLLGSVDGDEQPRQPVEADAEATEELLLRKLRQDDEEEMLEPTLKQPAVSEITGDSAPDLSAQTAADATDQSLLASSSDGHTGGDALASEQPPELVDWDNLDDPGERPAPWYGVNLAADGSGESGQPDEMNEWIRVLQEEGTSQVTTDALQETVESMEALEMAAEQVEETGVPLDAAGAGHKGEETLAGDEALNKNGSVLLPQVPEERVAGTGEEIEEQTQEDAVPVVEQHEAWEEDQGGQGAADDEPEMAEEVPDAGAVVEVPPGDGPEVELAARLEPDETGRVSLPGAEANGAPDRADPQEERRLWYEYLNLDESSSPQGRASEERMETEDLARATLAVAPQEEAGDHQPEQDATQPMALRDVQRERADPGAAAPAVDAEAERVQAVSEEASVGAAAGQKVQAEGAGAMLNLAVSEASLPASSDGEGAQQQMRPAEKRAPVLPPRAEQALSRPPGGEAPKKRNFWLRHFGWLWGAEE